MEQYVLLVEQCRELVQLGLDMNNAKLCWVKDAENDLYVNFLDEYGPEYCTVFPTYTLEEILNILPQHTTYTRHYANGLIQFFVELHDTNNVVIHTSLSELSLLDAAFVSLKYCIKNNLLKNIKSF